MKFGSASRILCSSVLAILSSGCGSGEETPARAVATIDAGTAAPAVVLVTLDTTRADALGSYGADGNPTPNLDRLAERGSRWSRAYTSAPMTLPAHATLMTGLNPIEHGIHDNGSAALAADVPTLAQTLRDAGWATAGFVSSRVLDRRFGLDSGFDVYGDRVAAERVDTSGIAERDGVSVTDEALAWVAERSPGESFFLWVHYFDPHSPHARIQGADARTAYAAEVALMDRQIGRLLAALEDRQSTTWIAAVGDHGEMLGEHGEPEHGLMLRESALRVPLIIAGPDVPTAVVGETASIEAVAASILQLAAIEGHERFGEPLPGLGGPAPAEIYSETWMPYAAYGWSPMQSLTTDRYRYVRGPEPELYDLTADPEESVDLASRQVREVERLERRMREIEGEATRRSPDEVEPDAEMSRALRSLGYVSGGTGTGADEVDRRNLLSPYEGLAIIGAVNRARALALSGSPGPAIEQLEILAGRDPENVQILNSLAQAQWRDGRFEESIATLERAVRMRPEFEALHLQLGDLYRARGETDRAREEYRAALEIDPRFAKVWLRLAETAGTADGESAEREILAEALDAGTTSAAIYGRIGEIDLESGRLDSAESHLASAVELMPSSGLAWRTWGHVAAARGEGEVARERYRRAGELNPGTAQGNSR